MAEDALAKETQVRFERMKAARMNWHKDWQDTVELVRPGGLDFSRQVTPGQSRNDKIYDGTALDACSTFASGLGAFLTNPSDRWFSLEIKEMWRIQDDEEALLWLDQVTDIIYDQYSNEDSGHANAMSESYLDLGAFGTSVINQEYDWNERQLVFNDFPLAQCYIAESSKGRVDTLFRALRWSIRQCRQEWGDLPPEMAKLPDEKEVNIIHAVYPRTDRLQKSVTKTNMPFASVWVCEDTKETIKESGYNSFPYHVPRWMKLAGEVYGRSPTTNCLPDIRVLNKMEQTILKAAAKVVDPPMVVPNDGFNLPVKTHPGGITYRETGNPEDKIEPLYTGIDLRIGREECDQKREAIKRSFHNDLFEMAKLNEQMTATEVLDRRDEKLRQLGPMFGRIAQEKLAPMISRSYELLHAANRFPPAPKSLGGAMLVVTYNSMASRAQTGAKATSMVRYIQELIPVAQIDPTVMDAVDVDKFAHQLAKDRGTPRIILRGADEIKAIRDARAQAQQAQQAAQVAEPASKALKNVAEAQAAGGGGGDLM